jgi:hypothetical protein
MLSWSEMRYRTGKVLILLTIALALANARCFSHCLVQPCGEQGTASCHSHGKSTAGSCAHHHDLTAPASTSFAIGDCIFELAGATSSIGMETGLAVVDAADPSPPPLIASISSLPLRV